MIGGGIGRGASKADRYAYKAETKRTSTDRAMTNKAKIKAGVTILACAGKEA